LLHNVLPIYKTITMRYAIETIIVSKLNFDLKSSLWSTYDLVIDDVHQVTALFPSTNTNFKVHGDVTTYYVTCNNCINCTDCTWCSKCEFCSNCTNCVYCSFCSRCDHCGEYVRYAYNCCHNVDCSHCTSISGCSNCKNCVNCDECEDCTNCINCGYCKNCTDCGERNGKYRESCVHCDTCNKCIDCTGCVKCKDCIKCKTCNYSALCKSCDNLNYCARTINVDSSEFIDGATGATKCETMIHDCPCGCGRRVETDGTMFRLYDKDNDLVYEGTQFVGKTYYTDIGLVKFHGFFDDFDPSKYLSHEPFSTGSYGIHYNRIGCKIHCDTSDTSDTSGQSETNVNIRNIGVVEH